MGPFVIGGAAVVLVVIGLLVLVFWLTGSNRPSLALFATKTPTPTNTSTPAPATATLAPTNTPTITLTPTETVTPTASGPFSYVVQEGDTLWDIAQKFKVDPLVLLALNNFAADHIIQVGDEILIPSPDQKLDTATPVPTGFRGDITYTVQSGDTLGTIAYQFYTTVDAIKAKNKITDDTAVIQVGQTLIVPVNIATHAPTRAPTSTRNPLTPSPTTKATGTQPAPTATKAP